MKSMNWKTVLLLSVNFGICALAQTRSETPKKRDDLNKPLVIASQGSFFVGGDSKALTAARGPGGPGGGDITINQMYVQYQIPQDADRHVPVVTARGCCLSSKTWETTPDGRMGWREYCVRTGRSVSLADHSPRAR